MDKRTMTSDDKRDLEQGLQTRYKNSEITAHEFQVGLQGLGWPYEEARSEMLRVQGEILKQKEIERFERRAKARGMPSGLAKHFKEFDGSHEAKRMESSHQFITDYLKK